MHHSDAEIVNRAWQQRYQDSNGSNTNTETQSRKKNEIKTTQLISSMLKDKMINGKT